MKKRNSGIDFMRIVFVFIILIYHGRQFTSTDNALFKGGAVFVEFFFIVSGYLMASNAFKRGQVPSDKLGNESLSFIKHKLSGIYPTYAVAFAITFITKAIVSRFTKTKFINMLYAIIPEFLLIQTAGYQDEGIISSGWYLSAMLLAMIVIYPLLRNKYSIFTNIIAPVIVIFGGGIMYRQFSTFTIVRQYYGFIQAGFLRALIFISLGCICFEFNNRHQEKDLTKPQRLLITFVELFAYVAPIYLTRHSIDKPRELFCYVLITIGTTITFSSKSYFSNIFNDKLCSKLAKLSLALFLSQMGTRQIVLKSEQFNGYYEQLVVYIIISFVQAFITIIIVDIYEKIIKPYLRRESK